MVQAAHRRNSQPAQLTERPINSSCMEVNRFRLEPPPSIGLAQLTVARKAGGLRLQVTFIWPSEIGHIQGLLPRKRGDAAFEQFGINGVGCFGIKVDRFGEAVFKLNGVESIGTRFFEGFDQG